jgi:hypothetical protein
MDPRLENLPALQGCSPQSMTRLKSAWALLLFGHRAHLQAQSLAKEGAGAFLRVLGA